MSRSLGLSPEIVAYLDSVNPPEHPALKRCREDTAKLGAVAGMQISAEQAVFMRRIARMVRARRAFELGVFTGYSALAVALEMMDMHGGDARLLACDTSEQWTAKAREYWREAGADGVIDLQLAPALQTLQARLAAGEGGRYDFGFIDVDKIYYDDCYEAGLQLLRQGGVMLVDNMLWSGAVVVRTNNTPDTVAVRALAAKARDDKRVHSAMLSVGDGILMCVKA